MSNEKPNTNTPKTDALYAKIWLFTNEVEADEALSDMRDLARELERERDSMADLLFAAYDLLPVGTIRDTADRMLAPHERTAPNAGNEPRRSEA